MFWSKCRWPTEGSQGSCSHCGADIAQAISSRPKKTSKVKHIVIAVVGTILALIALGMASSCGVSSTSDLPQSLEVGQSAQTSEQKVTVLSVQTEVHGEYTLVTVSAQVEAIGAGTLYATDGSFSLSDSEGNRYDTRLDLYIAGDSFAKIKELYQGEKTSGNLRFLVPTSATGLKVAYDFGTLGHPLLAKWQLDNTNNNGTTSPAPSITTTSLPNGEVNIAYSQTLGASGGSGTYRSWSITSGALPVGLSLNSATGVISGTPTTTGTSSFTVQVADSLGGTATQVLSITIVVPLIITTTSLPNGEATARYSQTLGASGGSGTYSSWSITSGALPAGLSLDSLTGVISGPPNTDGTSSFTVQVTDSLGVTAYQALSITVAANPTITTTSLPDGEVGTAYSATLTASGGSGSYTWSITAHYQNPSGPSLPTGLSFDPSTGVISGTPTTAGEYIFMVVATDSLGDFSTGFRTIIVKAAPLVITTTSLPDGEVTVSYSQTLEATGGTDLYTWRIVYGALPAGLSLDSLTGVISGTPTTTGTSSFYVLFWDNLGVTAYQALSITVVAS